ncbi:MAG: Haloacid dehalogenase domain protein hydrolase [Bacillales bacterium]|jgi:putative hydrolase of the HAD superfamily|nr:Haloacid dehalogenase domain protein hydrolase [Bacillales bacterium]
MKELILQSKVIFFDLDGTLYEGRAHFDIYAKELLKHMSTEQGEQFMRDYQLITNRNHALTIGKAYDIKEKLVLTLDPMTLEVVEAHTWEGMLIPYAKAHPKYKDIDLLDEKRFMLVSDGWWIPATASIHHGLMPPYDSYNKTKELMASKDYKFEHTPGLIDALTTLSKTHKLVLMTNTDEADAYRLLNLLGLKDFFNDVIAPANKPVKTKEHFEFFLKKYNALPEEAVSFGDNFINEIAPALKLGMNAVFISHVKQNYYSPQLRIVPTLSNFLS